VPSSHFGDLSDDEDNLVLQAARLFRQHRQIPFSLQFHLEKKIPVGAGLGGGSSDAAAALHLMNGLVKNPLDASQLLSLAARLGSDVPFFIDLKPALMRGRGECLTPLEGAVLEKWGGRPLLLLKPHFGVNTGWAYQALAKTGAYRGKEEAEAEIRQKLKADTPVELPYNSFASVVFAKYPIYPVFEHSLAQKGFPTCNLSGSGSVLFLLDPPDSMPIVEHFGEDVWCCRTSLASSPES